MKMAKTLGRGVLRWATGPAVVRVPLRYLSSNGLLPPGVWRRLPVRSAFQVRIDHKESFYYSGLSNDVIGRALYWRGLNSWEPETISVFRELVKEARVFVDVGANTGIYSLIGLAANPKLRVIAFEPVPRIRQRLEENLVLNGWQTRCEIRGEAVSDNLGA